MPLVRATENGTGQTESPWKQGRDVVFGLALFLNSLLEVFWKKIHYRVIVPYRIEEGI